MNPLGKGLESLIPKESVPNEPSRHLAEDILTYQENLEELSYEIRFASDSPHFSDRPKIEETVVATANHAETPAPGILAQQSFVQTDIQTKKPDLSEFRELPKHSSPRQAESVFWIEAEKIVPNPFQPRREFEEEALASLADSIRNYGVLQPLLVTKTEEESARGISVRYQLIAGERRWRAAQLAGLREVPVIIRKDKLHDRLKLELALIENVQREDLNPVERALAFRQLADDFRLTQKEISEKIGKSREYVTNSLRILTLPAEAQEFIRKNTISEGHGRALLMLSGEPQKQKQLLEEILRTKINVRESEFAARALLGHRPIPHRKDITRLEQTDRAWQKQLEDMLGTRVSLVKMDGGKGRIIVEFYSEEELRNILDKMIREV